MKAPLSRAQYGLYVECLQQQGEPCYNLPYLYVLDGSLEADKLCSAIKAAVNNHPTLFTRIELDAEGEPVQIVERGEFHVQCEAIEDIEVEKKKLIVPFDILKERLFHIRLLRDKEHFHLLLDMHHIIADGYIAIAADYR